MLLLQMNRAHKFENTDLKKKKMYGETNEHLVIMNLTVRDF